MSFELMKTRIEQSGQTLYEEQIKDGQNLLLYDFKNDVSYNPNIVDYYTKEPVPIKMYNQKFTASYGFAAQFLALHNCPIELGRLLYDTKQGDYWLCVESYDVDGIHYDGRLGKCGRFLRWQDESGVIKEIPMIVTSASKYNNGEDGITVLQVGSDQLMIYTQLNDDTVKLDRGMKFFVDENLDNPSVYELTRNDTALYSYMGRGFLSMILTECAYTPTKKELELGVCNYVEPSLYPSPEPEPEKPTDLYAVITGNQILKVGFSRKYEVKFTDESGSEVAWNEVEFEWYIESEFSDQIAQKITGNKIELSVDSEDLIGSSFLLQCKVGDVTLAQININISEWW